MNDTDKLVAAAFAAAMIGKIGDPKLAEFLTHYDACMKVLEDRRAAASKAASGTPTTRPYMPR